MKQAVLFTPDQKPAVPVIARSRPGVIQCARCQEGDLIKMADHYGPLPAPLVKITKLPADPYPQIIMKCPVCVRSLAVLRNAVTTQFCMDCGHAIQDHGCGCN